MNNKKLSRILIGGTIGNLAEWYNFLLYGYLASVISQQFFPTKNEIVSLTFVFTVFAISFLMRPIGGILFGWIGDRYGRQRALVISLIFIAIPTFFIGCLPTYQQIGIASPILLSILRIMQGLSAGGEHTGSAVYLAEQAPVARRTLWVSSVPASAAFGILLSSFVSLLIINSFDAATLLAWGWRVAYWAGTLLCLISLCLRIGLPETPDFEEIKARKLIEKYSLMDLLRRRDVVKDLLIVMSLASCWGVFYQILFIWMPTYLAAFQHLDHHVALKLNSAFLLAFTCLILLVGYVADYMNRQRILFVSSIAMLVMAYPIFKLLSSHDVNLIITALSIYTFIFSLFIPTAFVSMVEIFPAEVRYTALSFAFNMGLAIFGGTCPLIATWLIKLTGQATAPAFYLMIMAICALMTCFFVSDERMQKMK